MKGDIQNLVVLAEGLQQFCSVWEWVHRMPELSGVR